MASIIANFTLESYRNLQPDSAMQTVQLLERLVNRTEGSTSTEPIPPSTFTPSLPALFVNIFWFLSLLFTLSTASLGVFIKQWLQRYSDWQCTSSQERLRVRHVRYRGLIRFRILQLTEVLPLLLQTALMCFLVGLVCFMLPINLIVGWTILSVVMIWAILLLFICIVPFVAHDCPYRISFIRTSILGPIKGWIVRTRYGPNWMSHYGYENSYYRFPGDERGIRREVRLGLDAVISADASLVDNNILRKVILPCLGSFTINSSLVFVRGMLSHRLEHPIASLYDVRPDEYRNMPTTVLDVLLSIFCDHLRGNHGDISRHHSASLEMCYSMYIIVTCVYTDNRWAYLTSVEWPKIVEVVQQSSIQELILRPTYRESPFTSELSLCRDALMTLMVSVPNINVKPPRRMPELCKFIMLLLLSKIVFIIS